MSPPRVTDAADYFYFLLTDQKALALLKKIDIFFYNIVI
jgi:hypothetical protein